MKYTEFAELCRFYTKTNSTTFTDSMLAIIANTVRMELASEIASRSNRDEFVIPQVTNLIAAQREYPFASRLLPRLKYLEAKLDGENWIELIETDIQREGISTNESDIVGRFGNGKGEAYWDSVRNSIFILSGEITNVTDGLKAWFTSQLTPVSAADLASNENDMEDPPSDTELGFPGLFHELWARKVSMRYKSSKDKPIPLSPEEARFDMDLEKRVREYTEANLSVVTEGKVPYDDGYNY